MASNFPNEILIVDDNKAHRMLVRRALEKAGLVVGIKEAQSLGQARDLLFSTTSNSLPSLVFIDLNLADGRGSELTDQMRKSKNHSDTPVVIVSTSSLESDIRESYLAGGNAYICKSADPAIFLRDIARAAAFFLAIHPQVTKYSSGE